MLLPFDLLTQTYKKPQCFLCETDKSKICPLETFNMSGTFKFNSYSELTFDVARIYNDIITGTTQVNPYYDKIEALRLVYLEGFGYFELQDPETDSDGIKEVKSLMAYSLEYTLSQKYLETFYINKGTVDSLEVLYAEECGNDTIIPITLYNPKNPKLSLLHLILEKVYGWKIGHVDSSLQTMSRQFEIDRESVYDFIMNEICKQFNCYVIFDTVNNTINFYAETRSNKFTGDGVTNTFAISPIFSEIGTVTIDGYKTINYTYNNLTGELILGVVPPFGAMIEVTDGSLSAWETDVYITFDNLAQQMKISYPSDDIKTVLTVKGADDLDIREVNNGLPYIVDLSYFSSVDWMGQDLYDAYTSYLSKCTQYQSEYKVNSQKIIEISNRISYETNRLSLQYSEVSVSEETVGTYYVRGGDSDAGYYYTEVSLPSDYVVGTTYYSTLTTDINEEKIADFYEALKTYYSTGELTDFTSDESTLADDFSFMEKNTISGLVNVLGSNDATDNAKDAAVLAFFNEAWEQLGLTPLKTLYYDPYKTVQTTNVSAGWAESENDNYGLYYPVVLILESLQIAINAREKTIAALTQSMTEHSVNNAKIGDELLIDNNFTDTQLVRLSAFLREDEYTDNNFVATGNESTEELFKLKQELLECGRIELSKLCEPCLKFSMSLANIYALLEFAPIVNQFQLGNLIKVALRKDYVKHTRLMEVSLNFEDFSDFSCTFGDLSSIRSQTDLHADLLSQAVSAGKTVASNASYWNKGSDTANAIDVRVQQGLLNAATEIKSIDGNQNTVIDKYGIHLQEKDPVTGEISPEQGWIVNNKFLYSDDAFKTTKSVFGKYTIDDHTHWGLLADAVIAGYIEGSQIVGGTIQIGKRNDGTYNFEVDENGYITMVGGKGISSNGEEIDLDDYNTTVEIFATGAVLSSNISSITLTCKIYSYGVDVTDTYDRSVFRWLRSSGDEAADQEWNTSHYNNTSNNVLTITANDVSDVSFFQCQVNLASVKYTDMVSITLSNSDVHVFTSKPDTTQMDGYCYNAGDLWVVGDDYSPNGYLKNTILISLFNNTTYLDSDWVESAAFSQAFMGLDSRTDKIERRVIIDDKSLRLRASSDEDMTFESLLTSDRLSFGTWSGGRHNGIVWLGIDTMNARNVTVENRLEIAAKDNAEPYLKLGNFNFKIEDNGSLSIM